MLEVFRDPALLILSAFSTLYAFNTRGVFQDFILRGAEHKHSARSSSGLRGFAVYSNTRIVLLER